MHKLEKSLVATDSCEISPGTNSGATMMEAAIMELLVTFEKGVPCVLDERTIVKAIRVNKPLQVAAGEA